MVIHEQYGCMTVLDCISRQYQSKGVKFFYDGGEILHEITEFQLVTPSLTNCEFRLTYKSPNKNGTMRRKHVVVKSEHMLYVSKTDISGLKTSSIQPYTRRVSFQLTNDSTQNNYDEKVLENYLLENPVGVNSINTAKKPASILS